MRRIRNNGLALLLTALWAMAKLAPDAAAQPLQLVSDPFERLGVVEFKEGQKAPPFELTHIDGRLLSLAALNGKLIAVNFWATWCTPCKLEMPSMEQLYQRYKEKGFELVAISIDRGNAAPLIESYVADMNLTFHILIDSDERVRQAYRVRGIPTTFLIAPHQDLLGAAFGPRDWAGPEAIFLIERLLSRYPVKR